MSLPSEKRRALVLVGRFLDNLTDPVLTKRVPKEIRDWARMILRHYPTKEEIERFKMLGEDGDGK